MLVPILTCPKPNERYRRLLDRAASPAVTQRGEGRAKTLSLALAHVIGMESSPPALGGLEGSGSR